jgi:hypothetical protein
VLSHAKRATWYLLHPAESALFFFLFFATALLAMAVFFFLRHHGTALLWFSLLISTHGFVPSLNYYDGRRAASFGPRRVAVLSKWQPQQQQQERSSPSVLYAKQKKQDTMDSEEVSEKQLLPGVLEEWKDAAVSKWQQRPTARPSDNDQQQGERNQDKSLLLSSQIQPQLEQSPAVAKVLLLPLARALEESTDGWALEYADLSPDTPTTPAGFGFLATNLAYTICGLLLVWKGNVLLGILTELASVASFAYHFCQLKLGKNQPLVRVALLVDYVVAAATLLAALVYIIQVGIQNVPFEGIIASILAVVFLFLSWVWEEGIPYVINHGLWHLLGAYGGFIIGQATYN